MKYQVVATRTTIYEVEAGSATEAEDLMIDGEAKEVDGDTSNIEATPLCPDCDDPLSDRTTRTVDDDEEPTYCDTCDREIDYRDLIAADLKGEEEAARLCSCGHRRNQHTDAGECGVLSKPGGAAFSAAPYVPCPCSGYTARAEE